MKVYGADICIDCRNFKHINESRNLHLKYINITDNTSVLKEFLALRDHSDVFRACRETGGIGVPCFVDGERITLDIDEAFSWIGQPPVADNELEE